MNNIPVKISELVQQIKDVNQHQQVLERGADAVRKKEQEIKDVQSQQKQMLDRVQSLLRQQEQLLRANQQQQAAVVGQQAQTLRDIEYPRLLSKENDAKAELVRLEKQRDDLEQLKLSSLIKGFSALMNAVNFISGIQSNFEQYIWLYYLKTQAAIGTLAPGELKTLTDVQTAQNALQDFTNKLEQSRNKLTAQEKTDVSQFNRFLKTIPEQEAKQKEMATFIEREKEKLAQAQSKLINIGNRKVYTPAALRNLLIGAIASFAVSIALLVGYIYYPATPDMVFFISSFILGCVLLWLRYYYDKEKRTNETTADIDNLNKSMALHTQELATQEKNLATNKIEWQQIIARHPILNDVDFAISE